MTPAPTASASTRPPASRPSRRRSSAPSRGSTALGHRVVVDPTCDDALAALLGGRRRAARGRAAHGRRSARRARDRRCAAATAGRGSSTGSTSRRSPRRGKRWLGHSDFTAFQLAALAHAGHDDVRRADGRLRLRRRDAVGVHARPLLGPARRRRATTIECALDGPDFDGEGTLWGGNLAMVAHLVGTPHFPRVDGGILFLEDIGEHPYRVERMLYQLHFAGVLARQRAVLLGTFNGYELDGERQRLRRGGDGRARRARISACAGLHGSAVRPHVRRSSRCRSAAAARSTCATARARLVLATTAMTAARLSRGAGSSAKRNRRRSPVIRPRDRTCAR